MSMTAQTATAAERAFRADFEANRVDLPGRAALDRARGDAMSAFAKSGLPHRRIEEWKYTDLRAKLTEAYDPATPWAGKVAVENAFTTCDAYRIVFANGYMRRDLSTLPETVEIANLADGVPDWATARLAAVPRANEPRTAALTRALARDGVLLRVGEGVALDKPIHLAFVDPAREGAPRAMHGRNLIVLEKGARATLIETHGASAGAADLANWLTEIDLGDGASLDHLRFVTAGAGAHVAAMTARLGKAARYAPFIAHLGGALVRSDLLARLDGAEAALVLNALGLLTDAEHADLTTIVEHASPGAASTQTVKHVLGGRARGVYQSKVVVQEGANGTDARQLAKSVLLSREAEADTKPELEILADDVKCSHGASVGALDDDALFYLRARGIPASEARTMLTEAFVADVLDGIAGEAIRVAASAMCLEKLHALEETP